ARFALELRRYRSTDVGHAWARRASFCIRQVLGTARLCPPCDLMDLSDLIARNAAFTPEKAALRYEGRSLTYAELALRIEAAARGLKSVLGVGRGDRVAILAANHPDYLVLLYACARLGALLVTLNWRLAVPELLFILADASAKVLIVQDAFAAVAAPLRK